MKMARMVKIIIREASLDLPPILLERELWSGWMAMARIKLHKMILANGYMINRHQAMISKRIKSRMVVS
jgi:hypothetical protein